MDAVARIAVAPSMESVVDEADLLLVGGFRWHLLYSAASVYAITAGRRHGAGQRDRAVLMHRLILDAPDGLQVDHINGNGLDNRRCNLRLCTAAQNRANQHAPHGAEKTSAYKGVCWYSRHACWRAQIKANGRNVHLGYFRAEEDAARAYDAAARRFFGEFACLNFPDGRAV